MLTGRWGHVSRLHQLWLDADIICQDVIMSSTAAVLKRSKSLITEHANNDNMYNCSQKSQVVRNRTSLWWLQMFHLFRSEKAYYGEWGYMLKLQNEVKSLPNLSLPSLFLNCISSMHLHISARSKTSMHEMTLQQSWLLEDVSWNMIGQGEKMAKATDVCLGIKLTVYCQTRHTRTRVSQDSQSSGPVSISVYVCKELISKILNRF